KPLIYGLYKKPLSGSDIEARSFDIIDREAPAHHFTAQEWEVVRRMIHTVGDFGILGDIRFSSAAITAATAALQKGCQLYVDSNMIRNGLSLDRLHSAYPHYRREQIHCYIADDDVAREAREQGLPRSLFAVRKAKAVLDGGIAVFGNAPVALLELNRFIMEEGLRPALVVAMPVGFVHVIESKKELMSLGVPCISLMGRRGGSPLAVSVIHALCSLAAQPVPRKENNI
ncbi:MAG: precorrin-8X methylmutase, partial [Syntrophales bacterium]|nr:precorrin-8X methylmutase [Syntrophales bacterium]